MDHLSEERHDDQSQNSTAVDDPHKAGLNTENRTSGPLTIDDLRRNLRRTLVAAALNADSLFKRLIDTRNSSSSLSTLVGAAVPTRNLAPSDPAPATDRLDKYNELDGPLGSQTQSQLDSSEVPETPDISRTVVVQRGNAMNREKRFYKLSEEEYDSVETNDTGAAIELRKDVYTIKPESNNQGLMQPGNKLLNNDIVDHVTSERIIIRSPQLLKMIKAKIYWPSAAFYDGQRSLLLDSPYRSIGVYRDILGETLDQMATSLAQIGTGEETLLDMSNSLVPTDLTLSESDLRLTVRHLELFLREVDKVQGEAIQLEEKRHRRKMATFDMLWKLFKPGMVVYTEKDGVKLACRVRILIWSHGSGSKAGPDSPYQKVEVVLWYLDHDGRFINRRVQSVSISRYHGEKSILELPVYPQHFLPDWENERMLRIQRGRKYIRSINKGYKYCNYSGEVSIDAQNPYNRQNHQTYYGKVLVDPEQHFRESGESKGPQWLHESDVQEHATGADLRLYMKLDPKEPIVNESEDAVPSNFGDDQLFLLPEWIRGFTMATHGNRKWVWLRVDGIQDYKPDRSLVKTIALDQHNIDLLKAMTHEPQGGGKLWSPEVIEHKGTGRVIILHGFPGLGKTYTAECLAEWSERPLLRLTCAELGLDPEKMEVQLASYLQRAERWKAMVLMDEADVYMSKRLAHSGRTETGIVSVFLRALEYFSGIIILTTNMIHNIDRAIVNRALLIVGYKTLSREQVEKLTSNCLERFRDDGSMKIEGDAELLLRETLRGDAAGQATAKYEFDGREIVQVLTIAIRLVSFEHDTDPKAHGTPRVAKEHVQEAIRIVQGHRVHKEKQPELTKSQAYEKDAMG